MKHIGNGENTIANAIWLLLTYFYINRQLFTTAFKNIANLHLHTIPNLLMKLRIFRFVHWTYFLSKYGILKLVLGVKLIF